MQSGHQFIPINLKIEKDYGSDCIIIKITFISAFVMANRFFNINQYTDVYEKKNVIIVQCVISLICIWRD